MPDSVKKKLDNMETEIYLMKSHLLMFMKFDMCAGIFVLFLIQAIKFIVLLCCKYVYYKCENVWI